MEKCYFSNLIKGSIRCGSRDHDRHTTDILMANPSDHFLECEGYFDPLKCECYDNLEEYKQGRYDQEDAVGRW